MPRVIIAKIEQLENKWIYLSKVMDALKNVLNLPKQYGFL